ncbi:MAG: chorismate synthase, partial [Pseudomonadota bacterium]
GVPPRIEMDIAAIQAQLDRRKPGQSDIVSARKEEDKVEVLSGFFGGQTTGAPICLVIYNKDAHSEDYSELKDVFRPGHADYSWWAKYGVRDWRGGGRASGRETVARVAAGAVARQILAHLGIRVTGHVVEIGGVHASLFDPQQIEKNSVRCADAVAAVRMIAVIKSAQDEGDSAGGVVEVRCIGVPVGWGDPVFGKLDAMLAGALMSIGAVKGVEIGDGFELAKKRGSEANDEMTPDGFVTNNSGGIIGGVSIGTEIVTRIAVKPTPSIHKAQRTVSTTGSAVTIEITGRHDPCIAPRLVPVAEAMVALVLVDAYLGQRALVSQG